MNIVSEINFSENIDGNKILNPKKLDVIIKLGEVDISSSKELINNDLFRINKDKKDYFLYWKDIGTFKVSDGKKIIVSPEGNIDEYTLNSYIMGPVFATLLYQRGLLVLHASAVKMGDHAVAFLGYSGIGKSTIAMALNKKGYPLITDDILAIEMNNDGNVILPGFPQLKLSSEMISLMWNNLKEKPKIISKPDHRFHCATSNFSMESLPLKSVYIIEEDIKSHVDIIKPQEALMKLVHNSYCFILFENRDKLLNLNQCSTLMKDITVYSLKVNKSIKELPKLAKKIEDHIQK
ncbi:hypothetical protein [Methanobacterium sp.]|uniref:hypothetical protein n=1 Tax=Methanobacterium sp. TaxID=2164 RepID=UPI003C76F24D